MIPGVDTLFKLHKCYVLYTSKIEYVPTINFIMNFVISLLE